MSFRTFVSCTDDNISSLLSGVSIQVLSMLSNEVIIKHKSFYKHFSDIYFYKLLNYGSSRDSFDIYNGTTHTIGMFSGRLWLQYASRGS